MAEEVLVLEEKFVLTIFGASGDLAKLKIFPSIFALAEAGMLPANYWIIGYARSEYDQSSFVDLFRTSVQAYCEKNGGWSEKRSDVLEDLLQQVYYYRGQYDKASSYSGYAEYRNELTNNNFAQELFYFSIPPSVYVPVVQQISDIPDLDKSKVKLVMEKPFGTDEVSATQLFHVIGERFVEDQVYLIDHYLGKPSVRSILAMRHNNRLLNSMFKGKEVANIQITANEPFGVEGRLGYFDKVGTFRDMLQSHLLQVLALVTMSIPVKRDARSLRQEKESILSALCFEPADESVCLGQYEGYCDGVEDTCNLSTATFGALRLTINRESWFEVPIYIRSGKYVGSEKKTNVVVELKKFAFQSSEVPSNKVVFELAPTENIHFHLFNEGDDGIEPIEVVNSQTIACSMGNCLSDHALLLMEAIQGEQMYFLSFGEIIACWKIMDQVMEYTMNSLPERYQKNSRGPDGQDRLMGEGEVWMDSL